MIEVTQIEKELRAGQLNTNPSLCAEYRAILSGHYSFWCGMLEDILSKKPSIWNLKRPEFKSDTACENWWKSTDDGINEMGISLKLKRIEKLMSGLGTLIKLAENQSKNSF